MQLVKDRQFPMLVPQAWAGIADRRRPDFVAFVPVHFWRYEWLAIQLDGWHGPEQAQSDALRDADVAREGYQTISVRPGERGLLEEVRRLVERIEELMQKAEKHREEVALKVEVHGCVPPQS